MSAVLPLVSQLNVDPSFLIAQLTPQETQDRGANVCFLVESLSTRERTAPANEPAQIAIVLRIYETTNIAESL